MKALSQQQKEAIAKYEAELAATASDEDWYVPEAKVNDAPVHPVKGKKGWTAQRDGEGFAVAKDGEFKFYAIRLKAVPMMISQYA